MVIIQGKNKVANICEYTVPYNIELRITLKNDKYKQIKAEPMTMGMKKVDKNVKLHWYHKVI